MDKIKTTKVNDELYYSVEDVLRVLSRSKSTKEAIEILKPKEELKGVRNIELSKFNQNLKTGLGFDPNEKKNKD